MIKILFSSLLLFLFSGSLFSQKCNFDKLSVQYDFTISINRFSLSPKLEDSTELIISIFDKDMRVKTQEVKISSNHLLPSVLDDCSQARSFQTANNCNKAVVNNDYGDFVVGDFNFDGNDDFAIKVDSRIIGGPSYEFYLQNEKAWFVKDDYLSDEMKIFPSTRNFKKKTLITRVMLEENKYMEKEFKYNNKKRAWKFRKESIVRY